MADQVTQFLHIRSQRLLQGMRYSEIALLRGLPEEFQVTQEEGPLGDSIRVEIEAKLMPSIALPHDTLSCELLLSPQFPLSSPTLICHTSFTTPSIADGRDLVEEVLEGQWNREITLRRIVEAIPGFVVREM